MTSTSASIILAPTTAAHRIFDDCSNHDTNGSVVSTIAVSGRRRTVSIRQRQGRQRQQQQYFFDLLMKIAVVLFLLLMSTFTIVVATATPTMTTVTITNTATTGPSPRNIYQLIGDRTRVYTQQQQHSICTSLGGWKHHVTTSSMKLQSRSRQVQLRQHQRTRRSIQQRSTTTASGGGGGSCSSYSCSRLIKRPTITTKALTFRQMEFLQYVCVLRFCFF
jgi:hypothetical protein